MDKLITMEQVHGNRVVRVVAKDGGHKIGSCDGIITNSKSLKLAVKVADCLPILLRDLVTESFGVLHAGWRGLESNIIKNGVELMMKEFGSDPSDIFVYIGAHICASHYEIKDDVASKFAKYKNSLKTKNAKIFLDLGSVAKTQLLDLGINTKNIKEDTRCTLEEKDLFSYRRGDRNSRNIFILTY